MYLFSFLKKSPVNTPKAGKKTNLFKINKLIQRFKLRDKSPLICIVEYNLDTNKIHDVYFQLHDKHAAYSSADLDNLFLKEDIISFIRLSN